MKTNLLIADDRKEIADQIAKTIAWEKYDIFPMTAYNGKDAWETILNVGADIVVTDIEMPILSGLQLAEKCKENNIKSKIIILSGYDNFSYARQALSLGVSEYLLKPVSTEELLKTILRVKEQLQKENSAIETANRQYRWKACSLPILKNALFKDLIQENISPESFHKKAELANLEIRPGNTCLVMLVPHWMTADKASAEELHTLEFGISNMTKEIFSRDFSCEVFWNEKRFSTAVLNYPRQQRGIVTQYNAYQAAIQTQKAINEYFGIDVTVAISQCYTEENAIQEAYRECVQLIGSGGYQNKNVVLSKNDCETNGQADYPQDLADEILRVFSLQDLDKTLEKTRQLCHEIMKERCLPPLELKNKLCNLLIRLGYTQGIEANVFDLSTEFLTLSTMEEVEQWMCNHICQMCSEEPKKQCTKDQIEAVQAYIEENYSRPISLKEISESLYVSQSYLSSLFKEHMGVNFTQYLTDLRMEKAKELLCNSRYKVYEIAEMVGYSDTRYFAELFRKNTGCLPKQWVKQQKNTRAFFKKT